MFDWIADASDKYASRNSVTLIWLCKRTNDKIQLKNHISIGFFLKWSVSLNDNDFWAHIVVSGLTDPLLQIQQTHWHFWYLITIQSQIWTCAREWERKKHRHRCDNFNRPLDGHKIYFTHFKIWLIVRYKAERIKLNLYMPKTKVLFTNWNRQFWSILKSKLTFCLSSACHRFPRNILIGSFSYVIQNRLLLLNCLSAHNRKLIYRNKWQLIYNMPFDIKLFTVLNSRALQMF